MKLKLLSGLLASACLTSTAWAGQSTLQDFAAFADKSDQTVVYTAKEFITMDEGKPSVAAVAVRDGKFVALGSLDEVKAAAGSDAIIDEKTFADQVVMPGFVEQHVHPVLAAITMNTHVISIEDWDTIDGFSPAVRDPENYQKRLVSAVEAFKADPANKGKPFITWGYHHYMHGKDMSRELLNQLAPDFPAMVWHRSAHEIFLNDAALKQIGIDQAFIDALPESAQKQVEFERGHFYEQGLFAIMAQIAPLLASPEAFKRGLEYTEQYYHQNGITTAAEPGGFLSKPVQDAINAVYSDDATPFNHYFMVDGKSMAMQYLKDEKQLISQSETVLDWGKGRTAYLPKQVKLFMDGAIFSQLMQMSEPYTDGHHGEWIMDPPVFNQAFQTYWDAGYQIHIHNNGDAGAEQVLKSLQEAMARNPRKDHRTVLVHFGFARPEQIKQWIELGGLISSNPYYVTALAGRYGKLGMTNEWAQNMVPHQTVLENNGSLSFHSDMPMAPAKPLQLVWAAVNRLTYEGEVAGPNHKVPLDKALRAITIDAAFSIQQENQVGSISVGKDANLTVLGESPYAVKPEAIKDIVVKGTMLEGRWQPVIEAPVKAVTLPATIDNAQLQQDTASTLLALIKHRHSH